MKPEGWRATKLAELLDGIDAGWSPQCASQPASPDAWGVLKLSAITSGRFLDSENKALPEELSPRATLEVRVGDLLLARANGAIALVGRTALVRKTRPRLMISDKILRLRPRDGASSAEFLHVLLGFDPVRRLLTTVTDGSHMRNISQSSLREVEVLCPPLGEQRRIAAILSVVDDAIEATQAVIDQLQVVTAAIMAELLTRGLPGRHTRFKQTEIGEVPDEWTAVPISEVVTQCDYGISSALTTDARGIAVLRMSNMQDGCILLSDLKYAPRSAISAGLLLAPGDVLFNRTNSKDLVGKVGVFQGADAPVAFASYLLRLRVIEGRALGAWLSAVMNLDRNQSRLRSFATPGVSQVNINRTKMLSMMVPLPPVEEQTEIVAALKAITGRTLTEQQGLAALSGLKGALMSALLTGEVRVAAVDEAAP